MVDFSFWLYHLSTKVPNRFQEVRFISLDSLVIMDIERNKEETTDTVSPTQSEQKEETTQVIGETENEKKKGCCSWIEFEGIRKAQGYVMVRHQKLSPCCLYISNHFNHL